MITMIVPTIDTQGMALDKYYAIIKEWSEKVNQKLGTEITVDLGHEYTVFKGAVYTRYVGGRASQKFFNRLNREESELPDVLCPCGSTLFSLRYGYYEIRARCAACGEEDVVYDG